jgi:hypothetical protein
LPNCIGSEGTEAVDPGDQFVLISIELQGGSLTHKMLKVSLIKGIVVFLSKLRLVIKNGCQDLLKLISVQG